MKRITLPPNERLQKPPSNFHLDEELDDFTFLDNTPDQNPVVLIRNNILEEVKDTPIDNLPPMLGVKVIMNYERKRRVENILELPEGSPNPTMQVSLKDFSLGVILYDGRHWGISRENLRSQRNKIEILLTGIRLEFFAFNAAELDFRLGIAINNIEVFDRLEVSNRNMLLCYNTKHLRATGSQMASVLLQQRTPRLAMPSHALLRVDILPLRLNIDQDARYFLTSFFSEPVPQLPDSQTFWDEIHLSDVYLQVDYKAKRLDRDPLNWCSLAGAEFNLSGATVRGERDFSGLVQRITDQWWSLIRGYTLGLGPLGPLVNLSTGFANIFYKPFEQYQKHGRLLRGKH